jgi:uncharacterized protein (DUF1778 family)
VAARNVAAIVRAMSAGLGHPALTQEAGVSDPSDPGGEVELRLEPSLRARLRAAAQRLGVTVEDLILAAAADRADEVLGDTRVDAATLADLGEAATRPPEATPRLDALAERPRRIEDR